MISRTLFHISRIHYFVGRVLLFKKGVLFLEKGSSGFEHAIICDDRRGEAWKTFAL
jgi:hypothetical protein